MTQAPHLPEPLLTAGDVAAAAVAAVLVLALVGVARWIGGWR